MTASDQGRGSLPKQTRIRCLLRIVCYSLAVIALGFPVAARAVCWPHQVPDAVADTLPLCVLLAFLLLLTLGLMTKLPAQAGLFLLTLLVSLGAGVLVCHFASLGPVPDWLAALRRGPVPKTRPIARTRRAIKTIGIYRFDPRYGYGHIPDSRGRHESAYFKVTYTIDDQGCRATPTPESPRGTILITGGSFTFGLGVQDSECFPAILAREYWTDYKVRNRAVCGYGTVHAYLAVSDALTSADRDLPALVIYAMIPHHVQRNYLRRSYIGHLAEGYFLRGRSADPSRDRRGHPHFEIEDGRLISHGLAFLDDAIHDSPCLRYPEFALTQAFLTEMRSRCADKQVPLFVVLLPENGSSEDEETEAKLKTMLPRLRLPHVDIAEMPLEKLRGDNHPNPASHRRFAEAIAQSPIAEVLIANGPQNEPKRQSWHE